MTDIVSTFILALFLGAVSYRITRFLVLDTLIGMGSHETVVDGKLVHEPNSKWGGVIFRFAYYTDDTPEHQAGEDRSLIRGKIGDLLGCVYCTGFWVSAAVLAGWAWSANLNYTIPQWGLLAFGVAGVQAWLSSREDG